MSKSVEKTTLNAQFWQKYENCLARHSIKAQHIRWYIGWCQQFVKFIGQRSLTDCQPEHVSAFLDNLHDSSSVKDWQWSQARVALWHLFRDHLRINWALDKQAPRPVQKSKLSMSDLSAAHQATLAKMRSTLVGRLYAKRTVTAYLDWGMRFLSFYPQRKIADLDANAIRSYLTHLAEEMNVAVNTQKQALNALVFLFQESEGRPLGDFSDFSRAKKPIRVPVVLTREEVTALLGRLDPPNLLICQLLIRAI